MIYYWIYVERDNKNSISSRWDFGLFCAWMFYKYFVPTPLGRGRRDKSKDKKENKLLKFSFVPPGGKLIGNRVRIIMKNSFFEEEVSWDLNRSNC